MYPIRNRDMGMTNVKNKTRGTLSKYERDTDISQEHLGKVSYEIHMESWPRLPGLLPPKITLVWLITLQIIICTSIFYGFLMTRINSKPQA